MLLLLRKHRLSVLLLRLPQLTPSLCQLLCVLHGASMLLVHNDSRRSGCRLRCCVRLCLQHRLLVPLLNFQERVRML